jgi:hypothetical protein
VVCDSVSIAVVPSKRYAHIPSRLHAQVSAAKRAHQHKQRLTAQAMHHLLQDVYAEAGRSSALPRRSAWLAAATAHHSQQPTGGGAMSVADRVLTDPFMQAFALPYTRDVSLTSGSAAASHPPLSTAEATSAPATSAAASAPAAAPAAPAPAAAPATALGPAPPATPASAKGLSLAQRLAAMDTPNSPLSSAITHATSASTSASLQPTSLASTFDEQNVQRHDCTLEVPFASPNPPRASLHVARAHTQRPSPPVSTTQRQPLWGQTPADWYEQEKGQEDAEDEPLPTADAEAEANADADAEAEAELSSDADSKSDAFTTEAEVDASVNRSHRRWAQRVTSAVHSRLGYAGFLGDYGQPHTWTVPPSARQPMHALSVRPPTATTASTSPLI